MLVSFLVPLYNVEKYVEECVRSLFEQSYPHCEYIFVDDASPDRSSSIVEQLVDREFQELEGRVRIIRHSENRGPIAARQTALNHANGRYVIFIDSDDWCHCEMVSKLLLASENGVIDIVSSGYINYTSPQKQALVDAPWINNDPAQSTKSLLTQGFALSNRIWGLLIKRDLLTRGNFIFDPTIRLGDDLTMLIQMLLRSERIAYVDDYLYYYRQNVSGSITQSLGAGARFNYLRAVALSNAIAQESGLLTPKVKRLQRVNIKRWLLNRSAHRNAPSTLIFRLYCYIKNRLDFKL